MRALCYLELALLYFCTIVVLLLVCVSDGVSEYPVYTSQFVILCIN